MEMNDDLLISYLLGEGTSEERKQIEEWGQGNPSHQHRLDQFRLIWETSKKLGFEGEIDAQASLKRLKEKAAIQRARQPKVMRMGYWLKIAAAVFLIAGGAWFYTNRFPAAEVDFLTQENVKADTLSDGSVITLNRNSLLRYPERFRGRQRQVWLTKGEAFFKVSPDKEKPFLIHTGGTLIRVVGTSFNVKNKAGMIEVIVETGIVEVSRNGKMVSLRPGERVQVKQNSGQLLKEHNPDQLYNYYRSKEFIADDTPLWRMVQVLNEAYDSHIVIGRKELNDLPLNTTFKNESLDNVLQVISRTFTIRIERKHNQIILY